MRYMIHLYRCVTDMCCINTFNVLQNTLLRSLSSLRISTFSMVSDAASNNEMASVTNLSLSDNYFKFLVRLHAVNTMLV